MYRTLIYLLLTVAASLTACGQKTQDKSLDIAIYLLPDTVKASQVRNLDVRNFTPSGTPVIEMADIRSYSKDRHELAISDAAGKRLNDKKLDLRGKLFVIVGGDKPVYAGAFWTDIWSQSFDGVYIDVADFTGDSPVLKLKLGYPKNFHNVPDPRSDARITEAFEKAGLLR